MISMIQVKDIVEKMEQHTILNYRPQIMIVDFIENYWLKNFPDRKILLEALTHDIEMISEGIYLEQFPHTKEEKLKNFSSAVVFHLAFRLKQIKETEKA